MKGANKLNYTLLTFGIIILLGVGVFAYGGTTPTVVGHSLGEIDFDSGTIDKLHVGAAYFSNPMDQLRFTFGDDDWYWMSKNETGYAFAVYSPPSDGGSQKGFKFMVEEDGDVDVTRDLHVAGGLHVDGDIDGVCKANGDNCPSLEDLRFSVKGNDLCYATGNSEVSGCELRTDSCFVTGAREYFMGVGSATADCADLCSERVACNGDVTGYECGENLILAYYDDGDLVSLEKQGEDGYWTYTCDCSAKRSYNTEVLAYSDTRCVTGVLQ